MLETAYRILEAEGGEMKFQALWAKVKAELDINEEEEAARIGRFYTDLSMSGQFVVLPNNVWDLRSRHTYDKVHIDVSDAYSDANERDDDASEVAEEAEYDASVHGTAVTEEEEGEEEEGGEAKPRESAAELLGGQNEDY